MDVLLMAITFFLVISSYTNYNSAPASLATMRGGASL
jgi:hypothetical protein